MSVAGKLVFTLGQYAHMIAAAPDVEEGRPREELIERLKAAGCPWPPPRQADVILMRAAENW
jgi:hypothetical protein